MRVTDEHKGKPNLSAEAFQLLLTRLGSEPEAAGLEYERLRVGLANYFRLKGLSGSFELADLTLDRVARLLTSKDVSDLAPFCFGVARLICLEQFRSDNRQRTANEDFARGACYEDTGTRYELMRRCLSILTTEDQELLKSYFAELPPKERSANRENLARNAGIPLERLRLKIHRLRRRLENCLNQSRAE